MKYHSLLHQGFLVIMPALNPSVQAPSPEGRTPLSSTPHSSRERFLRWLLLHSSSCDVFTRMRRNCLWDLVSWWHLVIKYSEHSGCFNIKKFLTLSAVCVNGILLILSINSDYFAKQPQRLLFVMEKQYALFGVGSTSLNII
jgi:hypothetical protein